MQPSINMTTPRIHARDRHYSACVWLPPRDANTVRTGAEAEYEVELASPHCTWHHLPIQWARPFQ